jgi:hypothetical protein
MSIIQPTQPPRVPVRTLRAECLIQCPHCLTGIGFLCQTPIEPGKGIEVKCPSCSYVYGFQPYFVQLREAKRLIL